jgi:2-polyprenyl-3-methyl-5-hydroxy-6-metoxy-1,4-benzoquinol methylase
MWYRLIKFQGMVLIPPFIVYCLLRRLPFFFRCRKCHSWLDQPYMSSGICENCHREIVLADPIGYFVKSDDDIRQREVANVKFRSRFMCHLMYKRVAERIGGGKVIDVGCGQGYLFLELLSRRSNNLDLYGIDIGEFDIQRAKNWIEGGKFCLADGQSIPYKPDTFDELVCTEVLEHLPKEQGDNTVSECYRVLKPGGVAIFSVPNGKGVAGKSDPHHIRHFTFKSITGLLEKAGFEIIYGQKVGLYIPFISRFLELLNGMTRNRLPLISFLDIDVPESLSMSFFIGCGKPLKEE